MNKGGSQKVAGVEFRMVQAVHSSGTSGAGRDTNPPSDPCGYVLTFEDGFRIYHAGDTNVFSDMALIGELYARTSPCCRSATSTRWARARRRRPASFSRVPRVIPMHWGTFPALTSARRHALRDELAKRGLATEVVELAPGGALAPGNFGYSSGTRPVKPSSYPWKWSSAGSGYFQQ